MTSDISVVIPAYGQCPHLPEVVDAILPQSVQPTEIVVAHSGPFDPTSVLTAKSDLIHVFNSDQRLLGGGTEYEVSGGYWDLCLWVTKFRSDPRNS